MNIRDIGDTDRHGVDRLVHELEQSTDVEELRTRAVRELIRLIPADGAQWYHFDRTGGVHALALPADSFHADPRVIYDHPVDHPLTEAMLVEGTSGAWRVSDAAADREWRRTHCYNLDFRPFGMRRHLVASSRDEAGVTGYALVRGGTDFTDGQRDLLGYAKPRIAAAERLLTQRQWLLALVRSALDSAGRPGQGVAAVGEDGVVRALDSAAEALLPRLRDDPRLMLTGTFRTRDAVVRVVPCAAPGVARLVLIRDLGAARAAARRLGLTEREHRTLEHIDAGRTPAEAARAMGISLTTVRGYVASLHRKLSAGHTAQLLRKGRESGLLGE
ncbi:response regulator transcription factor [Streptomyces sp. VRA16 Mangrove soil]|uniref:response regulator transcription factor n=1 Tax=Streptomyces sp. VRA16 Mangrove soil TaxID=2817434 RepID=UPI001A9F49A6|nr:helix-turn-helix transcriptional regulator [Streptomyces sp. VRA16 Mangrove soil]MBO1334753.1 helix-turn-helix transcriptional regulator [Streptomyces sp. VRA16 Mangrove soil]